VGGGTKPSTRWKKDDRGESNRQRQKKNDSKKRGYDDLKLVCLRRSNQSSKADEGVGKGRKKKKEKDGAVQID